MASQEIRDHFIGRILGCKAIISSGILVKPQVALEDWTAILGSLFVLARDQAWLREECGQVLHDAARDLPNDQVAQFMIDGVVENEIAKTQVGVPLWLTLQRKHPALRVPDGIWARDDPLYSKNRSDLARILKRGAPKGDANADKGGTPQQLPSFAFAVVLQEYLSRQGQPSSEALAGFRRLWSDIVDGK